jgi:hypothetical protein
MDALLRRREDRTVCCEQLVCAACGGPVAEARCSTCAVSRQQVHVGPGFAWTPELVAAVVALAAVLALLLR